MPTTTLDARLAGPVGRIILAESAVVAAMLALTRVEPVSRIGWMATAIAFTVLAAGRWRGRDPGTWLVDAARFATRRHTLALPIDPDGTVGTLELGDIDAHVTTTAIRLPTAAELLRHGDRAAPTVTPIVVTGGGYRRIFLAIRIDPITGATLGGALRQVRRRLDVLGIPYRPVEPGAAVEAALGARHLRETWDHLVTDSGIQATLRVRLGARGMTGDLLVRLADAPGVTTVLTWSDVDATLRLAAPSTDTLADAVNHIAAIAGIPVRRLAGRHLPALWTTLPLGTVAPAARRESREPEASPLMVAPTGLLIGHDRHGWPVFIRVPPDAARGLRITVAGVGAAARLIAARVRSAGAAVPAVVSIVEHPTAADSSALAGADVVVCHAMPAENAAAVATALGLAQAGTWLSRVRYDMVAVISDGTVRWALLPTGTVESQRITGLVGVART